MDRHLLDRLHHLPDLRLLLGEELDRQFAQGGLPSGFDQRLDEERLIDVAHPHLLLNELDEFRDGDRGLRFGHYK